MIIAVFLDFKRAFETIDRRLLLAKLAKMGVTGIELSWFENYLSNRRQRTKFNDVVSSEREVRIGLPQGSAISPMLFILYINDIQTTLRTSTARLFADDALITYAHEDITQAMHVIEEDLQRLYGWLCGNKLKLNLDKTKYMIIGNRTIDEEALEYLTINGVRLDRVKSIKYLGVMIDSGLKFTEHVNYVEKKIARSVGFMSRTCKYVYRHYKIKVYRAIVEPHFVYCSSLLFLCNKTDKDRLQKLQNRAMRCILKKPMETPIDVMLNELGWLSVKQALEYYTLILVFKMKHDMVPSYLSEELVYNREVHGRNLRNKDDFRLPNRKKNCSQNSLFYRGVGLYNDMETEAKSCRRLSEFKKLCLEFVKKRPIRE